MYNYQGPPGQYGAPPSFGAFPGQPNGPPGFGVPPGMGMPNMPPLGSSAAPGMQQPQTFNAGGFPPSFQPANMPNINFSAPVIRLGTAGPGRPDTTQGGGIGGRRDEGAGGGRRGAGLGFDGRGGDQGRDRMREAQSLIPPTREEVARTIFVGNITEGVGGDEGLQQILATAGGFRRWVRAVDADGKACTFGFAEFEDADSLATAAEVFADVDVPIRRPGPKKEIKDEGDMSDHSAAPEMTKLLVVVDENSQKYIEEWRGRGSLKDPAELQFRLDASREELANVLAGLLRPSLSNASNFGQDVDGDVNMHDLQAIKNDITGEIVTIPLTVEDELSDIPAEMRETVAKEIAAFRDRSTRRDLERIKREEDMEQAERLRHNAAPRINRLASPPPPSGVTQNGIPSGPRVSGVEGAPLGPKGFGAQIPRDYQKGVSFVNGNGVHTQEDEDTDASDEELERRRKSKKDAELEKLYLDQERRWLNRERSRAAALEREQTRDKAEASNAAAEKARVADRLRNWNDNDEASRKVEEYYHDRSQWLRKRAAFRAREAEQDAHDRAVEDRDRDRLQERHNRDMGMADQFLEKQAQEIGSLSELPREPSRFKMSLGAAAQKAQAAAAPRRTMADVEGLLEDEEDTATTTTRRTLIPIEADASGAGMTDDERMQANRQLASEIPSDKDGLWSWPIKWEFVDDSIVSEQLRPFVEKKIVEYLGVQEQMLVDVVETAIRKRSKPQGLVGELEGALDEEAEVLVKKLWRMLIFFSESEKRGLAA